MRKTKWLTTIAAFILASLLAWQPANAQERPCEVCLTTSEAAELKKKVVKGEKYDEMKAVAEAKELERNEEVAKTNVTIGQLAECRLRDRAKLLERDHYRDQARDLQASQTNPLRWISFGACGAFGLGAGGLIASGNELSGYISLSAAAVSCAAGVIFD